MRYIELEEERLCENCGRLTNRAIQYWKGDKIPTCSECLKDLMYSIGDSK